MTLGRFSKTGRQSARFFILGTLLVFSSFDAVAENEKLILDTPASPELQRVRTLIRANVLGLAERVMEEQGPPQLANGEWLNWERQLWALYRASQSWHKLLDRIQSLPPAFPAAVRAEAERESISALLALGRGKEARSILRRQFFNPALSERDKIIVRRQVIESYLIEDLVTEANRSARQFQQDFRPQDKEWLMLGARISLQSGNPDSAVNLLAPLTEPDARLLRSWARLKNDSLEPEQLRQNAEIMRAQPEFEDLQQALLAVLVHAAGLIGDKAAQAGYLEEYLLAPQSASTALARGLPVYGVGDLVEIYRAIALDQANQAGFLLGEEAQWGQFAVKLEPGMLIERRSVWAHIAASVDGEGLRRVASDHLINAAIDSGRSDIILELYGESKPLGKLLLSPATGLRLSNLAIEQGNVQLAAEANSNVTGPPQGMSYAEWLVYTGRISIIAGRHQHGAEQLDKWIDSMAELTPEQTDNILQPVFDLQTVDRHDLAIPLLEKINRLAPKGDYPREIAFWIAESYDATRQYVKAADYFLFSAMQKENGFDQWGESARYRAAEALLEGNFFDDARTLFEDLLNRASEEPRRQALQQKIQQLWLRQSSTERTQSGAAPG